MENRKPTYEALGVSSQKEDIHAAIKHSDQGLYPGAFCKIVEDIAGDPTYCSLLHADGAGTKSSIAYMMYSENKDLSVFEGIVQDSVIMNVDDVMCVGAGEQFLLSNTIGRNKKLISGEIIQTIIHAYDALIGQLQLWGLPIKSCGGETADVGDLVRTLIVDSTLLARMKRSDVINPANIVPGDVIVGLSSFGACSYEKIAENSGIGSNGLTLARHGLLHHDYYKAFSECYSPEIGEDFTFFGQYHLSDKVPETNLTVGEAILSPTRTYVPVLLELFHKDRKSIHAIFHNTGGGQTKCLKFGHGLHYIKDALFSTPPFFKLIQASSGTAWEEMYRVFNMGHRLEILCPEEFAQSTVLPTAQKYGVAAKIVGHIENWHDRQDSGNQGGSHNRLTINTPHGEFNYK